MRPTLPIGYRYLKDGEIITKDVMYFYQGYGPWTSIHMSKSDIGEKWTEIYVSMCKPNTTPLGNTTMEEL